MSNLPLNIVKNLNMVGEIGPIKYALSSHSLSTVKNLFAAFGMLYSLHLQIVIFLYIVFNCVILFYESYL